MPTHDKFEKINDATKVLIIGKKISAIVETLTKIGTQTGLEQEYKVLYEDQVVEILKTINEMRSGDNFPIEYYKPPKQEISISTLKKRIKYCKNPMEKKKLEQELNALYKEHKRNRRK